MTWLPAPLTVRTDASLGGRWTSLATPRREWLWRNPRVTTAERARVRPGDAFVDAGGGEECFPSVVGASDHGDVWTRPWRRDGDEAVVATGDLTLRRRLRHHGGAIQVAYAIEGPPRAGVLHALHLLLDVPPGGRIDVPGRPAAVLTNWPHDEADTRTVWPDGGAGISLADLGRDDGTARNAVVATSRVDVISGSDRLSMRWGTPSRQPVSLNVFRNLGGWPAPPYRSIGVEPLLGAHTDRDLAGPRRLARLDRHGRLTWWIELRASHRAEGTAAGT